jgi:hypothetical protein
MGAHTRTKIWVSYFMDINSQSILPYLKNGIEHLVVAKVDDDNRIVGRISLFFGWLYIARKQD